MRMRVLIATVTGAAVTACSSGHPSSIAPATSSAAVTPVAISSATTVETPAVPSSSDTRQALTAGQVSEAISEAALHEHLAALQAIADANGGTRATGTPGFDESLRYVETTLAGAGYAVERKPFEAVGVTSANVVVERAGSTRGDVVMLGAHVDSVAAGPGINDDGSGVAALIVIAARLSELPRPDRTVRFAFWGAEEGGPFGSAAYVASIEPDQRDHIVAYLNFDMIGSPNGIRFVYDEAGAAPGSEAVTRLFAGSLESAGLTWEPIDLEGDSDHGPFTEAGIPTGGLFSGGIEPKTEAQAATFGGAAGQPADACSHRACDTIDNVNLATLEQMAETIAEVLVSLANADG